MTHKIEQAHRYPEVGSPFFWPLGIALKMGVQALDLERKNMAFLEEVEKTEIEKPRPQFASPNREMCQLRTFTLRDFSRKPARGEIPTFLLPPYAGHTSVIADFHKKQSLVETLLENGITDIRLADWHGATEEMKDYDIDNYLEELHVAVTDLGGRVNLVGLCQGGWMASLYAARFPAAVGALVLAGSPIDTQAGSGVIKAFADDLPPSFYEGLVASGGGLLKGAYMLEGFKSMNAEKQYVEKYVELYEHIDDPDYVKRTENFERWYEYTINLPGKWYLQVVRQLFHDNLFVKGRFTGLGRTLDPKDIKCPLYLLAGEKDDITPKEQVFGAAKYFGTPKAHVVEECAAGGHIGLFMGSNALAHNWTKIAAWLKRQEVRKVA
ncbi:MAG: alpha/beta fold hydrolase [Alphaproteobacteria bacterium]|nr:alpha/beta fold hydrolase [Alphaproteobacteria bacterium]